MAHNGAKVILLDINMDKLNSVKEELKEYAENVLIYQCDVSDEISVNETVKDATDKFGTVDILVNNAALWRDFMIHAFSHEGMEGFYLWGFKDGDTYATHSLFYDELGNRKPCIDQWEDLIDNKWWTRDAKANTDANGKATIRGFYGDYDVTVNVNGKTVTDMIAFCKGYDNVLEIVVE